jgi:cell division septation protein DedD
MAITREQSTSNEIEDDDTEITLGMGKLLGLFFGLVILCGISLAVGYSLGHSAGIKSATVDAVTVPAGPTAGAGAKPGAAQVAAQAAPQAAPSTENQQANQPAGQSGSQQTASQANQPGQTQTGAVASTTDLTFYQSVQQKETHPQLTPQQSAPVATPRAQAAGTLGSGYLVQIAAVRNQADAKLLSDALQKQHYPVLIAEPGDKLFHVQVGPYADVKEAEAIRSRLVSSGYNAFLKR